MNFLSVGAAEKLSPPAPPAGSDKESGKPGFFHIAGNGLIKRKQTPIHITKCRIGCDHFADGSYLKYRVGADGLLSEPINNTKALCPDHLVILYQGNSKSRHICLLHPSGTI